MNIIIIDGHGGLLGAQLVKAITTQFPSSQFPKLQLTVIGTNAVATAAMLKAGAKNGATGENPVVVACRSADVIIGPIGIVIADSLLGEVTPRMATAIGQANAIRILIPMNKCENLIAGIHDFNLNDLIQDVLGKLKALLPAPL